jgi:hypothetical protein
LSNSTPHFFDERRCRCFINLETQNSSKKSWTRQMCSYFVNDGRQTPLTARLNHPTLSPLVNSSLVFGDAFHPLVW